MLLPLLIFVACLGAGRNTPSAEAPPPQPVAPADKNQVHPPSPPLVKVETWKITAENLQGHLFTEDFYDGTGCLTDRVSYDYYGSGAVESRVKFTCDDQGRKVKSVQGDTTETFTWDDQGRLVKKTFHRTTDGVASAEEILYDSHGREAEVRHLDKDGKLTHTWIYARGYQGDWVGEERKIVRRADGRPDEELYRYHFSVGPDGRVTERRSLREDGTVIDVERYTWDPRGNMVEKRIYEEGGALLASKEVITVDAFGDGVLVDSYQCSGEEACEKWSSSATTWDEYGHKTQTLLHQQSGDNFGERWVYTFGTR